MGTHGLNVTPHLQVLIDTISMIRICYTLSQILSSSTCRRLLRFALDIVGVSEDGFNLMVIDPPWENKSVHRKSL